MNQLQTVYSSPLLCTTVYRKTKRRFFQSWCASWRCWTCSFCWRL